MGVRGMLEGKNYVSGDTTFRFIAGFINHETGNVDESPITKVHTMYSDLNHV